jgi:hypothetical protein
VSIKKISHTEVRVKVEEERKKRFEVKVITHFTDR